MLNRRIFVVALSALTLFSGLGIARQSFGASPLSVQAMLDKLAPEFSAKFPKNTTIRLATGAFDPLKGVPSIQKALQATNPSHWFVQVNYPATATTRKAVQATGAQIIGQLPDVTYVVKATAKVADQVRHVHGVRWVGVYQPAYKLSPVLSTVKTSTASYFVWTHKGASSATVAAALSRLAGVTVTEVHPAVVVVKTAKPALNAIARIEDAAFVEPEPTYELHNGNALWTTDTGIRDTLGAAAPGRLDGAGQTAAVADTGINYIPDPNGNAQAAFSDCSSPGVCKLADYTQADIGDLTANLESVTPTGAHHRKMAGYFNLTSDPLARSQEGSWHGTHTSGSVAADYPDANGKYGARSREADGLAPAARLVFQDVEAGGSLAGLPADPYELFNQVYDLNKNGKYDPLEDARTHNNSYGAIYPEADPTGGAIRTDDFIYDHPDMTIVFSAANSGPSLISQAGGPQESKNNLTSCASDNGNQPLVSPDSVTQFSSHGPTLDGRIKPDVCTPGQIVVSPKGGTVDDDQYLQGTSMSGPVLVGLATLVRQYYWDGFGTKSGTGFATGVRDFGRRHDPSAALTKATIINSAQRMRGAFTGDEGTQTNQNGMWPSAGQGWGKVQLDDALFFPGDDRSLFTVDRPNDAANGLESGDAVTENIDVAPGQPLNISLVWTDPSSALPAGSPVLVNNLDLVVTAPDGTKYLGNDFTTESPIVGPGGNASAAVGESRPNGQLPDVKNNVEGVRIASPKAGRWQVTVAGTNVLSGPQGYALVATGRLATDTPRIVSEAPKYKPGADASAWLLGTHLSGDIAGFQKAGSSIYHATQKTVAPAASFSGGGVSLAVPVESDAPTVANVNVESVSADLARFTWDTNEKSTGEVTIDGPGGKFTQSDVYNVSGFRGLTTPVVETEGVYLNKLVVGTHHIVNVTGLVPGGKYTYTIRDTDEAGNKGDGATGSFGSTDAIYSPNATDQAMLLSGDTTYGIPTTDLPGASLPVPLPHTPVVGPPATGQLWGASSQFYAGSFQTTPGGEVSGTPISTVKAEPAFMFRLPKSLDPNRITAAAVEMFSAHDIVDPYLDRPIYQLDLLNSAIEPTWGPGETYTAVDTAPADVHLASDPTLRRGANVPYTWHIPCNDIDALKKNLSDAGSERKAAFRMRGVTDQDESLFSFEFGFGRRSRGPQLRPRLVLFLDGQDPMPCTATAAPKITDVLVDHTDTTSAIVSWRTDVPSDSTVYFRKAGTTDWTPVSAPVRITQHFVRVSNLEKNVAYEFVVRSATCNGLASVDDAHGLAYRLFKAPSVSKLFAADNGATEKIGWTTDSVGTSVVHYGLSPTALDKTATGDTKAPVTAHTVELPGLASCTRYYFRAESVGSDGQSSMSPVYTFDRANGTPAAVGSFDFNNGAQGWTNSPPGGTGTVDDPGAPVKVPNPTVWEPTTTEAGGPGFRTILKSSGVPGYSANTDQRLVSPPMQLPAGAAAVTWTEWYDLESSATTASDAAIVEVSGDNGKSWTQIRNALGDTSGGVKTVTASIPAQFGGKTIRIAFHITSDDNLESPTGGWGVDNVKVVSLTCPQLAAAAAAAPSAPSTPSADEATVILGPLAPAAANAKAIGILPALDPASAPAKKNGTCHCGPIHYLPVSQGGSIIPVTLPAPPIPKVLAAGRGRLPATGGGLFALPALGVFGGAFGLRRAGRKRRRH